MSSTMPSTITMLGLKPKTDLHDAVLEGLSFSALTKFLKESGLPPKAVYDVLHIPPRTLARRKVSGRLSSDESGHLLRLAGVYKATAAMFPPKSRSTVEWLCEPHHAFEGRPPIDMARTQVGTHRVLTLIDQVRQGVFI